MRMTLLAMITGAGAVLAVIGLAVYAADKGWVLRWWHWLLVAVWGLLTWTSLAWLGTVLGEGEPRAAWLGFFALLFFAVLLGLLVYRLMSATGKVAGAAGKTASTKT